MKQANTMACKMCNYDMDSRRSTSLPAGQLDDLTTCSTDSSNNVHEGRNHLCIPLGDDGDAPPPLDSSASDCEHDDTGISNLTMLTLGC